MDDYEVVAEELSQLAEKLLGLEERLTEVERVNARLEEQPDHGSRTGRGLMSLGRGVRRDAPRRQTRPARSRPSATTMRLARRGEPSDCRSAGHRARARCERADAYDRDRQMA